MIPCEGEVVKGGQRQDGANATDYGWGVSAVPPLTPSQADGIIGDRVGASKL